MTQEHRGPDAMGYCLFSFQRTAARTIHGELRETLSDTWEGGLAFNRLSIPDISPDAHQPMATTDGQVHIVFNGEIYNAADFRGELQSHGYAFRTSSDTEVILYLYHRFGLEETLRRLNGMFAFCILDLRNRTLLLARDRLGIKPLYLYRCGGLTLFSSEIKSFYAHPGFQAELEESHLHEFLTFRYSAGERTLLRNVSQLEPGRYAVLSSDNLQIHRYWEPPHRKGIGEPLAQDALKSFESALEESVRLRLLSDVPLGCQLSGGVDSSIINLLASRNTQGNLGAFSVILNDPMFSEKPWMDVAAKRSGVQCHQFLLQGDFFVNNLDRATWHCDLPINHPNSLGIFFLAQNARKLVTVLLSGEGADELLGGYPRHALLYLGHRLGFLRTALAGLPGAGKRFGRVLGRGPSEAWSVIRATAFNDFEDIRKIFPSYSLERAVAPREHVFSQQKGDFLTRFLNYEMLTYMVELLVRQDKMTMAHSLENRVPFLDHNLVGFVRNLRAENLVHLISPWNPSCEKSTKVILKSLARQYFSRDFVFRAKSGFAIPLREFFSHPLMRERMNDEILPGIRERGIFSEGPLRSIWKRMSSADTAELELLWACVSFEVWSQRFLSTEFRGFFDGSPDSGSSA